MKNAFLPLLAAALVVFATAARAAEPPPAKPVLPVVVVEYLQYTNGAITDFDRLELALQEVARERHWPVTIAAERFAANTATRETELRIFPRRLREEFRLDLTFRGWVILTVQGVKHDFGIVTATYYPYPGESTDTAIEKAFRRAALAIADKVEPVLFPPAAPAHP
ncbi:MAG TPA: hypothetical protein VG936_00955 [Lacunisphaera sp.]|nr:hypothetical protein [Lacunisphaera sp.]